MALTAEQKAALDQAVLEMGEAESAVALASDALEDLRQKLETADPAPTPDPTPTPDPDPVPAPTPLRYYGEVAITEFGAKADCNGTPGDGTDCTKAINDALAAVPFGGVVVAPPCPEGKFYRTRGDHSVWARVFRSPGAAKFFWDPDRHDASSCFRLGAPKNGQWEVGYQQTNVSRIEGIAVRGSITHGALAYSNPSSPSLPESVLTGAESGCQVYLAGGANNLQASGLLWAFNWAPGPSGVLRVGEPLVGPNGWSCTFDGYRTDFRGEAWNWLYNENRRGLFLKQPAFTIHAGEYNTFQDLYASNVWVGFALRPSAPGNWIEQASMARCKAFMCVFSSFMVECPLGARSFINECRFDQCESRSSMGAAIRYIQRNNPGGDQKISGHYWTQTEADCQGVASWPDSESAVYFDVDGANGEIEGIVFDRLTVECAGLGNPRPGPAIAIRRTNGGTGKVKNVLVKAGGNIFYRFGGGAVKNYTPLKDDSYDVHFDANGPAQRSKFGGY